MEFGKRKDKRSGNCRACFFSGCRSFSTCREKFLPVYCIYFRMDLHSNRRIVELFIRSSRSSVLSRFCRRFVPVSLSPALAAQALTRKRFCFWGLSHSLSPLFCDTIPAKGHRKNRKARNPGTREPGNGPPESHSTPVPERGNRKASGNRFSIVLISAENRDRREPHKMRKKPKRPKARKREKM